MLKKDFRLSKSKDISQTFQQGRSFFSPLFVVKYHPSPSLRFGVIVSTKVSKKAVERNRIKRIVREGVRLGLSGFVSGDYVIIVKKRAADLPSSDIRDGLVRLLSSLKPPHYGA